MYHPKEEKRGIGVFSLQNPDVGALDIELRGKKFPTGEHQSAIQYSNINLEIGHHRKCLEKMSKRSAEDVQDGNQAYLKRQKISNPAVPKKTGPPTEIHSAKQLRQLLAFDQDSGRAKHGKCDRQTSREACMLTHPSNRFLQGVSRYHCRSRK